MNHRIGAAIMVAAFAIGACAGDPGYPAAAHDTIALSGLPAAPAGPTATEPATAEPAALVMRPAPTLAATPSAHRCPQYEALLAELSPGWDVQRMSALMWRESRCTPTARNRRTHDWGALQIHWSNRYFTTPMRSGFGSLAHECGISSPYELLDVRTNVRCAAVLYRAFRYRPWGIRG